MRLSRRTKLGVPAAAPAVSLGFALVQQKVGSTGTTKAAALSVALDATPVQGNLLLALVSSNVRAPSVTGFVQAVGAANFSFCRIFYRMAGADEPATVAVAVSPSGTCDINLVVMEWSGSAASPLDKTASALSSGSTITCGTTTPTAVADELVVAAASYNLKATDTAGVGFLSWSEGFTAQAEVGAGTWQTGGNELGVATKVAAAPGPQTAAALTAASHNGNEGCIATFRGR